MIGLLSSLLIPAILNSLLAGVMLYVVQQMLTRAFPDGWYSGKYILSVFGLLFTAGAFMQPFFSAAFSSSSKPAISSSAVAGDVMAQPMATTLVIVAPEGGGIRDYLNTLPELLSGFLQSHAHLLLIIYCGGLVFFGMRLVAGYAFMQRLRKSGTVPADTMWQSVMANAKARLGITRNVRIMFSTSVSAPCIVGWAKAVVLIPVALAGQLTMTQAEAVLLHELAHYKLLHYYLNIVAQAASVLLFFNPFAWLMLRSANRYRELACDREARKARLGVALAESLVIIARQQSLQSSTLVLSVHSSKSGLYNRIQHLLSMKTRTSPFRTVLLTCLIAGMAVVCCFNALQATPTVPTDDIRTRLAGISREMQQKGNINFILVEAVLDSLIRPDQPYSFVYTKEAITINGVPLTGERLARYRKMMLAIQRRNAQISQVSMWSSEADRITLKDLLDPKSAYRNPAIVEPADAVRFRYITDTAAAKSAEKSADGANTVSVSAKFPDDTAILGMINDGFAAEGKPIFVRSDSYGNIFVNGRKAEGVFKEKYSKLINVKANPDSTGRRNGVSTIFYPEGVMAPGFGGGYTPRAPGRHGYTYATADPLAPTNKGEHARLTTLLTNDKLVDPVNPIHLQYTGKGLFINDKKLEGALEAKYMRLLTEEFSYRKPVDTGDMIDMTF